MLAISSNVIFIKLKSHFGWFSFIVSRIESLSPFSYFFSRYSKNMIILTTVMTLKLVVRWGVLTMFRWTTLITSKTKWDWREAEESLSHIWKINSFTLREIKMDFSYWLDFIRIARVSHKHLWICACSSFHSTWRRKEILSIESLSSVILHFYYWRWNSIILFYCWWQSEIFCCYMEGDKK